MMWKWTSHAMCVCVCDHFDLLSSMRCWHRIHRKTFVWRGKRKSETSNTGYEWIIKTRFHYTIPSCIIPKYVREMFRFSCYSIQTVILIDVVPFHLVDERRKTNACVCFVFCVLSSTSVAHFDSIVCCCTAFFSLATFLAADAFVLTVSFVCVYSIHQRLSHSTCVPILCCFHVRTDNWPVRCEQIERQQLADGI